MQEIHAGLPNSMYLSVCLRVYHQRCSRFSPTHPNLKLFWHQTPILYYNSSPRLSDHILMRGWIVEEKLFLFLFIPSMRRSSSAPCSPSTDKQLTFGMTHSTLISTKYSTVPLFKAVNLISEGISHLAIVFWTIKPISEE